MSKTYEFKYSTPEGDGTVVLTNETPYTKAAFLRILSNTFASIYLREKESTDKFIADKIKELEAENDTALLAIFKTKVGIPPCVEVDIYFKEIIAILEKEWGFVQVHADVEVVIDGWYVIGKSNPARVGNTTEFVKQVNKAIKNERTCPTCQHEKNGANFQDFPCNDCPLYARWEEVGWYDKLTKDSNRPK